MAFRGKRTKGGSSTAKESAEHGETVHLLFGDRIEKGRNHRDGELDVGEFVLLDRAEHHGKRNGKIKSAKTWETLR